MYGALRRILFAMDPERAHSLALRALQAAQSRPGLARRLAAPADPRLATTFLGHEVPHPLGVAAGFDKDGVVYNALLGLGFGHVEVGTVTPRPQPGNPRPRLHRLPGDQALVNRLGFPGPGMDAVAEHLGRWPPTGLVGVNVGPNKDTPAGQVAADVAGAGARLAPQAGYLAINVSSPNTPGLRAHQSPVGIAALVRSLRDALDDEGTDRPVLVKLHPDADDDGLAAVARAALEAGASGFVAANTTMTRPGGVGDGLEGGLSGAPLRDRAVQVVKRLRQALGPRVPIVGVGGIFTGADVVAALAAGADVVQTYTGFIYRGPGMAAQVQAEALAELERLDVTDLAGLRRATAEMAE